jgi:selenocysteine-specific elongation factor
VLTSPVFALPGDRLILRNAQASRTIAGGLVLDPWAPERQAPQSRARGLLAALEALIGQGDVGPCWPARRRAWRARNWRACSAASLRPHSAAGHGASAAGRDEAWLIDRLHWLRLREQLLARLAQFHDKAPTSPASTRPPAPHGLARPAQPAHEAVARPAAGLAGRRAAGAVGRLAAPAGAPQQLGAEQVLWQAPAAALQAGRYDPPWVRDLARAGLGGRRRCASCCASRRARARCSRW